MHYPATYITERLTPDAPVTVRLARRDSAWNPASTKNYVYGPATITYTRYPDGGIRAVVATPQQSAFHASRIFPGVKG